MATLTLNGPDEFQSDFVAAACHYGAFDGNPTGPTYAADSLQFAVGFLMTMMGDKVKLNKLRLLQEQQNADATAAAIAIDAANDAARAASTGSVS